MAHLLEFEIRGLVGRQSPLVVSLNRDINVFFGLNGCGKTSILRILASAMSNDATGLASVPFVSARVVIHSNDHNSAFEYSIDNPYFRSPAPSGRTRVHKTSQRRHIEPSSSGFGPEEDVPSMHWNVHPEHAGWWQHEFLPTTRLYPPMSRRVAAQTSYSLEHSRLFDEQMDASFEALLHGEWLRHNGKLQSAVSDLQRQALADILRLVAGSTIAHTEKLPVSFDDAYSMIVSLLKRQDPRGHLPNKEAFRSKYEQDATLQGIVAEVEKTDRTVQRMMRPTTQLQGIIGKMFSGEKVVKFDTDQISVLVGDSPIRVRALSSGEKHALRILLAVAAAHRGTAIIDEPELSMHIDWQRTLISSCLSISPDTQLIMATHSPEIMADIPDNKIFRI